MRPPKIPLECVTALGHPCMRVAVPQSYADRNGHMNMRHYVAIFDDAGDTPDTGLYAQLGLTPEFHARHGSTTMDLEFHISFLGEVMPGHDVAVYFRMAGCSARIMHYLMFMVDETQGRVCAIFECVNAFVDLGTRKLAPYPADLLMRLQDLLARHQGLDWPAPLSGAMQV